MPAIDTLNLARKARADGDIDRCVFFSAAAMDEAECEGDGLTAWHAAVAPGRAYLNMGRPNDALGFFRWALDTAGRHNLVRLLPNSYHWISVTQREVGDDEGCRKKSAVAFELYHATNPRNPFIANLTADVALADFQRDPTRENAAHAVQAHRAAPVSVPTPHNRLYAASNVMLAAATLGVRSRYRDAAEALETAFQTMPDHEGVAQALVQGARGAAVALEYPLAASLCERAELIAEKRGESRVLEMARAVKSDALAERVATV